MVGCVQQRVLSGKLACSSTSAPSAFCGRPRGAWLPGSLRGRNFTVEAASSPATKVRVLGHATALSGDQASGGENFES